MIWNREMECAPQEELRDIQQERLSQMAHNVYENVEHYRRQWDQAGIRPEDIQSLEDLRRIPFTTKEDLRNEYPYGLFAVPLKEIVRIHASSGTTGKPTVVGYTRADLATWSELVARVAMQGGASEDDIAQISFGYGLFTGALGLHYGLEKIGASVIPISSGNTEKQIQIMRDFRVTLLVSTPSYALYMAEVAEKMGVDTVKMPLRIGLFGGEGSTNEMRLELEKRWGIMATENYGLSEIMGPGVSGECQYKCGMHIAQDHFIAEIIDPQSGEVLPDGQSGELVLTPLTKQGLPLFRYRTHDITKLDYAPCACGRTTVRMEKIKGRSDDMLIIRGVNVFPSQIESVLIGMEDIGPHYEIVVRREGYLDTLEVLVEVNDGRLLESFADLERIERRICHRLRTILSIEAHVRLVEPQSLKRFEGKAKRVTDLRNG